MVPTVTAREVERRPEHAPVRSAEGIAAFDYTCRHYLKISGQEFLKRYDRGDVRPDDSNTALSRVFAMLPFVR
jgi:hypothetical protein